MSLKKFVNGITSVLVLAAFILLNLIGVDFAPTAFLSVLLRSGLMFACWLLIRNAMAEQGLVLGNTDNSVYETKLAHHTEAEKIKSTVEEFNNWCANKNKQALKEARVALMSAYSLDYDLYFDEDGNSKDVVVPQSKETDNPKLNKENKKSYKSKVKCLHKVRFLKVPPYVASEIMFRDGVMTKRKRFGHSQREWKQINLVTSLVISFVLAIVLAYVSAQGKKLTEEDIMLLLIQVFIMLGSAFASYWSAFTFVTGDWRSGLIQKTNTMKEYLTARQNGAVIEKIEPLPEKVEIKETKGDEENGEETNIT